MPYAGDTLVTLWPSQLNHLGWPKIISMTKRTRHRNAAYIVAWIAALIGGCSATSERSHPEPDAKGTTAALASAPCGEAGGTTCPAAQSCAIHCEGDVPSVTCAPPPENAAGLGEACREKRCGEGVCIGGQRSGPPVQCVPFCSSDADCGAEARCEAVTIEYACESTRRPVEARVCRPALVPSSSAGGAP